MHPKHHQHLTDGELLERHAADGNKEWLGILLQRYSLLLLGVCMKYLKNEEEAKDCAQQVCMKVIADVNKYQIEYFKSWLYKVCTNQCLMRLRSKGVRITGLSDGADIEHDEGTPTHHEREQKYQLLEAAIAALNPDQRQCVTLFYIQKLSYQQVSEQTGYSLLQVKSHLQNGKRNLRLWLQKGGLRS